MVILTVEQIRDIMGKTENIRNISIHATGGHEKATLIVDSLVRDAGVKVAPKEGESGTPDPSKDNLSRHKSTLHSLYYELQEKDVEYIHQPKDPSTNGFLINLIDIPGSTDFAPAVRVTDGILVVAESRSGISAQTETLLHQAIVERTKPNLFFDRLDHTIRDLEMEQEELYQTFERTVEQVNLILSIYAGDEKTNPMGNIQVSPEQGTVAFGSGLNGWAFTLKFFGEMYGKKFGINDPLIMMKKLWGDVCYSRTEKKWYEEKLEGIERSFNAFVLDPIYMGTQEDLGIVRFTATYLVAIFKMTCSLSEGISRTKIPEVIRLALSNGGAFYKVLRKTKGMSKDQILKIVQKLQIELTEEENQLTGEDLQNIIMRKWMPAGEALLQMIVIHLPSPVTAQKYRMELLYEGPTDDEAALGVKSCDPKGPLMMYVSKMVPTSDKGQFYAFGRVFSGVVKTGQKVRIMGPNYTPGKKEDLNVKSIRLVRLMTGRCFEPIDDVPCGNMCGLEGVDQYLVKTGTLTTFDHAHRMKMMNFSCTPVVKVAVEPKNPSELPKLVEGLKLLEKSDPLIQAQVEESGTHIVAGADEPHVQSCLKDLEELYAGIELRKADPVVSYRESVRGTSGLICLSKSPNKHNRLYMTATSMDPKLTQDIENKKVYPHQDFKERGRYLADTYDYDVNEARKIWAFGPEGTGPNLLIDVTKGVQYLNEIKDSVVAGFQWATKEGVLCDDIMRGVRFNIKDVTLHTDAIHRGSGQIIPTARRCIYACQLTAEPCIIEPIYLVDIQIPMAANIEKALTKRRGVLLSQKPISNSTLLNIKAHLPVSMSFGLSEYIKSVTGATVYHECTLDHWREYSGDPRDPLTEPGQIVLGVRQRKGLSDNIPSLDKYLDKL